MGYGFRTKNYQIPVPQLGDTLEEAEERRAAEIVDTQLTGLAKTFSGGHGVISEGTYSGTVDGSGVATVTMSGTFEGFIEQIYVTATTLRWENISVGTFYLYVQLVETGTQSSVQFGNVATLVSPSLLTGPVLLLARVTNDGTTVTIDTNPSGKIVIKTVKGHSETFENPHGDVLYQTTLVTSGLHISGTATVTNLEVSGNLVITGALLASGIYAFDAISTNILSGVSADIDKLTVKNLLQIDKDLTITGALVVSGQTTFYNHVILDSGVTIDGIDPSTLIPLIDGSNADSLHTHSIEFSPGTVTSGVNFVTSGRTSTSVYFITGDIQEQRDFEEGPPQHVFHRYTRTTDGPAFVKVYDRPGVPHDFQGRHEVFAEVYVKGSVASGNGIRVLLDAFDSLGNAIALSGNDITPTNAHVWERKIVVASGSGMSFVKGDFYTARYYIELSASGVVFQLGEAAYPYMRVI